MGRDMTAEERAARYAKNKLAHKARVITKRTAAGKPARADRSNSPAFRAAARGAKT
jgi:hypothetical protein